MLKGNKQAIHQCAEGQIPVSLRIARALGTLENTVGVGKKGWKQPAAVKEP